MSEDAAAVTAEWAGEKGRFWAENADWFSAMLAEFGTALVEGAAFAEGERVLDVGCGGGNIALDAAAVVGPAGSVLGVDVSPDELEVARQRAAARGLANVEFRVADAGRDDFGPEPVDIVCSRFGVMFFPDPVAAFTHLRAALTTDGRLAFVCWQALEHNEWMVLPRSAVGEVLPLVPPEDPHAPGGFAFRDPDRVRSILASAGFTDVDLADVRADVHLGGSADEAVAFVQLMDWAKAVLEPAPAELAEEAIGRARQVLDDRSGPDGIDLPGRAWLVTARP